MVASAITGPVAAQTDGQVTPEISYPVAELGNCADKASCKVYCDEQVNVDACLSFAERNNLMSKEEIKVAKNFKNTGMTGPGGCKGKDECSSYCNGPDHMDECITFAEKNGLMSKSQLEEAKKVQVAISKGIKPPACGGKEACSSYCSSSEHVEECVKFAEVAGIISKEDAEMIRKKGGPEGQQGPGGDRQGQGKQGDRQGPERQGNDGGGPDGGPRGQDQGNGGPGGGGKSGGNKGQGQGQGGRGSRGQQGPGGGDRQGPGGGGNGGGGQGQGNGGGGGR